jgi:twitching motility two-component system response regulator PilH
VAEAEDHQPTVLIVEDFEPLRDAVSTLLVREGYLVLSAATGHDALAILRQPLSPIDVVVLDVHLPDINGVDLCMHLRKTHPKMPVIVCTGVASPAEAAQLLELGAHRYFQKPVSAEELLSSVEAALP